MCRWSSYGCAIHVNEENIKKKKQEKHIFEIFQSMFWHTHIVCCATEEKALAASVGNEDCDQSARKRAGWSRSSLPTFRIKSYCRINRWTENILIGLHRSAVWCRPFQFAYGIRALFSRWTCGITRLSYPVLSIKDEIRASALELVPRSWASIHW